MRRIARCPSHDKPADWSSPMVPRHGGALPPSRRPKHAPCLYTTSSRPRGRLRCRRREAVFQTGATRMTQENSRLPSSLWMLDRAERLFETAETAADPAEASSLRRMGTNFLAGAEANGATVSHICARYRIAYPVE